MNTKTVVFLLILLASNFSYALDVLGIGTDFVKQFVESGEEDPLHTLMKPGNEDSVKRKGVGSL